MSEFLTSENYRNGFLIDEEWMAGVSETSENSGRFSAFVMNHSTGEYVGYQEFSELSLALQRINGIQRSWKFEASSECGGCGGEEGGCGKGACKQGCQTTGHCELES